MPHPNYGSGGKNDATSGFRLSTDGLDGSAGRRSDGRGFCRFGRRRGGAGQAGTDRDLDRSGTEKQGGNHRPSKPAAMVSDTPKRCGRLGSGSRSDPSDRSEFEGKVGTALAERAAARRAAFDAMVARNVGIEDSPVTDDAVVRRLARRLDRVKSFRSTVDFPNITGSMPRDDALFALGKFPEPIGQVLLTFSCF